MGALPFPVPYPSAQNVKRVTGRHRLLRGYASNFGLFPKWGIITFLVLRGFNELGITIILPSYLNVFD